MTDITHKIQFHSTTIRNFLSFGDTPTTINYEPGLHLVTGYNHDKQRSNGCGKTAYIVDSLVYALFGTPIRNVKQASLVNRINAGDCVASTTFNVGKDEYTVTHGEKPKIREVVHNGKTVDFQTVWDMRERLISILGGDIETYKMLIVLTDRWTTPFIDLSLQAKRDLIENVLNIGIYGDIADAAKIEMKARTLTADAIERELSILSATISEREGTLERLDAMIAERKQQTLHMLQTIKAKLQELSTANTQSQAELDSLGDIDTTEFETSAAIADLISQCADATVQLKEISTTAKQKQEYINRMDQTKACPFCGITFDKETAKDHKTHLSAELDKLSIKQTTIKAQITHFQQLINDQKTKLSHIKSQLVLRAKTEKAINNNNTEILHLKEQWETIKADTNRGWNDNLVDEHELHQMKTTHASKTIALNAARQEQAYYDAINTIVGKNLKQFCINRVLPYLNKRINFYLQAFGAEWQLAFDSNLKERISERGCDNIQYGTLSGGELKRTDVALLLAFYDLACRQNNVVTNVQIFDEILDSGLDMEGTLRLITTLRELAHKEGRCIYLITHRDELKKLSAFDTIINIDFTHNFSEATIQNMGKSII